MSTKPDVFIIESLKLDDEKEARCDGKILYDYLKLLGKNPIYYYIRTKKELTKMSELLIESKYRYLYISCHGNQNALYTTLDEVSFDIFSDIFKDALTNRRIFISGCKLGNKSFAKSLFEKEIGLQSITAPTNNVEFCQMLPFWSTFFYITTNFDKKKMIGKVMHPSLKLCSNIFHVDITHFFRDKQNDKMEEIKFNHTDIISEEKLNKILELKK